eukprot:scaffold52159_cov31-Tisochrysis_lutea.AAC.3
MAMYDEVAGASAEPSAPRCNDALLRRRPASMYDGCREGPLCLGENWASREGGVCCCCARRSRRGGEELVAMT